ncbi:hypothetical protein UFOVP1604_99 [uncultured Caudovirales phage]|uniref:Uncharacterized protein n=1 Tax=uncultured Caudovirales phage TaxID=2100421 RepID=A0A6J5SVI2_9CAUD|nr:hypothetical protein UFOVP1604_99 [uncultured Caudovirales phage]
MIQQIDVLIKDINTKPNWSAKELAPKLQSLSHQLENQLQADGKVVNFTGASKKSKVKVIRKYDLLYLAIVGVPHYFLIHKIDRDTVFGIIFTSTNKPEHCIHEVLEDRILEGSFATCTYFTVSLAEAMDSFIRVYESKKEADDIFVKVKAHYKTVFNFK